jgi:GntR family transcriptional regulator
MPTPAKTVTRVSNETSFAQDLRNEIDHTSPIPLYHQVYNAILDGIRRGRYSLGKALPTEAELCKSFGVSRITIRQALAALIRAHHLLRESPRGPLLLKSAPIVQELKRLDTFFTEDALAQGSEIQFICRDAYRLPASQGTGVFGFEAAETVVKIDRILVDQHSPLALLTSFIPDGCCPGLLEQDLNRSLRGLMATHYGLCSAHAVQWISARNATDAEADLLGLPRRGAVVIIKRLSRTSEYQPIEFLECVLRADRYEFVMQLTDELG